MGNGRERGLTGTAGRLGVWKEGEGTAFALFVPEGEEAALLLYREGEALPFREIPLQKSPWEGEVWGICLEGFEGRGLQYNFRIGERVTPDPRARALCGREAFGSPWEEGHGVRCRFFEEEPWEDSVLELPYEELLLYKIHVRGYTMHKQSKVRKKGTFAGLEEKIPYWKSLGINAVELMPAYEFLERPLQKPEPASRGYQLKQGERVNFWGYTGGFYFAPKSAYCAGGDPPGEFRHLVKALHGAGMLCFMEFYFGREVLPGEILEILRYWRRVYHVDGFHLIGERIPQEELSRDPYLKGAKLFFLHANPAALPGRERRLGEYNGEFAGVMRRLLKGDEGMLSQAAALWRRNPAAYGVINYMAIQDGFTLADTVSYDWKHNEDNGEENRDGSEYNYSWNCGAEGPTRKAGVRKLRKQQLRNAFLMLLLAQGTPLLYGGDEFGNSQGGNNNAYCQDNEVGWVDWGGFRRQEELFSFVREAVAFRKRFPILHMGRELSGTDSRSLGCPDVSYHSQRAWVAGMEYSARHLGVMYSCAYEKEPEEKAGAEENREVKYLYLAYNFHWEPQELALPVLPGGCLWLTAADTSDFFGNGFYPPGEERELADQRILTVPPRTVMALVGK